MSKAIESMTVDERIIQPDETARAAGLPTP